MHGRAIEADALFFLDSVVYLFTMHRDVVRRMDTNSNLITFYAEDGDGYIVTDPELLSDASCKNQHASSNLPNCVATDNHGLS